MMARKLAVGLLSGLQGCRGNNLRPSPSLAGGHKFRCRMTLPCTWPRVEVDPEALISIQQQG